MAYCEVMPNPRENIIRPAEPDDAVSLLALARRSFPDSLLWHSPRRAALRWLHELMAGAFCEIWVDIFDNKPAGFLMLVLDTAAYSAKKNRYQRKNTLSLIFTCPVLLSKRVWQRLISRPRVLNVNHTAFQNKPANSSAKTLWLEFIAVLPEIRGQGRGKALLRFCEHRARELGCHVLKLNVFKDNKNAVEFYEKNGFSRLAQTEASWIYGKNQAV